MLNMIVIVSKVNVMVAMIVGLTDSCHWPLT